MSHETSLTPKQAVFDAAPRETKTVAPPLGASAEQQAARVAGETRVLSSFDAPRERPNEPPSAAQTTRMASPSPEKQSRSDLPANPSVRAADAPKATDAPELNRETPSSPRIPTVLPSDFPLRGVSSATSGKPAAELAVNGTSSRPAAPSDESAHAAASSQETASEHPSAAALSNATNREALARVEAAVPTSRTRLTVEQIRELQALVARALQSAQGLADGSTRATFNWAPEGFGPLRFSFVTRDDGVRIEISSNRREVVQALEEGRANMERTIADLGLRVERFEVRLRAPEFSDSLPQPRQDGGHPERNSNAEPGSSDTVSIDRSVESSGEEAEPARRLSLAEHEWVA
ncbi:MAG: flagellar hook-length control protein FliK [bacterium]|nr:flagellar hook-length control protein FliK [bacterium]